MNVSFQPWADPPIRATPVQWSLIPSQGGRHRSTTERTLPIDPVRNYIRYPWKKLPEF